MPDILTITLNPTVDISTSVPEVVAGPKLRCAEPQVDPGGGGLNVSRAIRNLGGTSQAFAAMGGGTGQRLAELLDAEGIDVLPFRIGRETRQSLAVSETGSGRQFRFVLPGPKWNREQEDRALDVISSAVRRGSFAVLSGSQPPGVSAEFPKRLAARLRVRQALLVVDTSGEPLRHMMENPPRLYMLRMDQAEAEDIAGGRLVTRADTARFAADLVARDVASVVVISRGEDGSILADSDQRLHCQCPAPEIRSAVGAGDSFVAAFTLALVHGHAHEEALRQGVAAASAAVMTEATELCRGEDARSLLSAAVVAAV